MAPGAQGKPHSPREGRAGLGQAVAPADLGGAVAEHSLDVGDGEASLGEARLRGSGSGPAPGQRLELQGAPRGYSVQEGSCPVSRLRGAVSGKVYREAALRAPSTRMALHHQWSVVPGDEAGTAAVLKGSRQVGVRADSHPGPSAFSFQSFLSPGSAQQEAPAGSPVARGLGWGWGALSPGQPCSGV